MTWQLLFFGSALLPVVWHIANDKATPEPDSCPLCDARIKHTHQRR